MSSKKIKTTLVVIVMSIYKCLTAKKIKKNDITTVNFKSIVIYSTTALGDLMFNTPAIRAVCQRYPEASITLVSSNKNRQLVENCPWFSQVIYWDQQVEFTPSVIFKLRKNKPELSILLHSKSPYDVLCATLSGSTYILKDDYSNKPTALDPWLSAKMDGHFSGHLIERKLALVGHLGCDTQDISMSIPVPYQPAIRQAGEVVIGFQLGASEALRRWPIARFQELARLLFAAGETYRIVLIGSPQESALATAFLQGLSAVEQERVTNFVGHLSLVALIEKISGFDLLVTGDTGPLHLAVALRIHSISLFVTANPAHTGPLQDPDKHTVIRVLPGERVIPAEYAEQPMAVISAQEVMAKIEAFHLSDIALADSK